MALSYIVNEFEFSPYEMIMIHQDCREALSLSYDSSRAHSQYRFKNRFTSHCELNTEHVQVLLNDPSDPLRLHAIESGAP